jgi:imidazolonepropionase-like amidohydrolase
VELGGRVALGTDAPFGPSGGLPLAELEALAAAGLAPRDVLLAATRHGAEAAGRGADLGRIAAGYRADLLVVDGDPLAGLAALRRVRIVVLDGAVIVPESEP